MAAKLLHLGRGRDWLDEVFAQRLVAVLREEDGEHGAAAGHHFAFAEFGVAHERARGLGAAAAITANGLALLVIDLRLAVAISR